MDTVVEFSVLSAIRTAAVRALERLLLSRAETVPVTVRVTQVPAPSPSVTQQADLFDAFIIGRRM